MGEATFFEKKVYSSKTFIPYLNERERRDLQGEESGVVYVTR
jgi:hypothetical protein